MQERYDDAMFDFSRAEYAAAVSKLRAVLEEESDHFEARLALGMALYRSGDYAAAISEGHKAEMLRPKEQLAHTNLSLFYMKAGDKQKAEHHGLQARLAGWRENMAPPGSTAPADSELKIAAPAPKPVKTAPQLPEMPWKKKTPAAPAVSSPSPQDNGSTATTNGEAQSDQKK